MTKNYLTFVILCISISLSAQEASVEKSTFGIQTGILGVWAHNEARLTNKIALRSEIGMDIAIFKSNMYSDVSFLMGSVIILEPRFYYNLEKRIGKNKSIEGNSGNFISIRTSTHPNILNISSNDNVKIVADASIIPSWGLRRSVGKHFTYETDLGIGYAFYYGKNADLLYKNGEVAVNLTFKLGYRF